MKFYHHYKMHKMEGHHNVFNNKLLYDYFSKCFSCTFIVKDL